MASVIDWKTIPLQRTDRGDLGAPAAKHPDPDLGHGPIPAARYTSKDFMALEWERMWTKVWLLGGREELIPEPGDWLSHELGGESFHLRAPARRLDQGLLQRLPAPR